MHLFRGHLHFVDLDLRNRPVGQVQNAVGHPGNHSVMGNDHRRRTDLSVDALQSFKHNNTSGGIKRSRRLVA